MQIPANTIYPRTGDRETVYLNAVVSDPNISVGDYTIYNDFLRDPTEFVRNNVLYHYPINGDRLVIGKFCSIACGAVFLFTSCICTTHVLSGTVFRQTVSQGVAGLEHFMVKTPEDMIYWADQALYLAKREGRDTIRLATDLPMTPVLKDGPYAFQ